MTTSVPELQLDALRELANIGSGTAATALSRCSAARSTSPCPAPLALPLPTPSTPSATRGRRHRRRAPHRRRPRRRRAAARSPDETPRRCAACSASRPTPRSASPRSARSATSSALLHQRAGGDDRPGARAAAAATATDMLGAIVAIVLVGTAGADDLALLLDSELDVEGEDCSISFLLLPDTRRRARTARAARAGGSDGLSMAEVRMGEMRRVQRTRRRAGRRSASARASAWRSSTARRASPGWRTSCCPSPATGDRPGRQVRRHRRAGAHRARAQGWRASSGGSEAVLVGGAQMFDAERRARHRRRNEAAVRRSRVQGAHPASPRRGPAATRVAR